MKEKDSQTSGHAQDQKKREGLLREDESEHGFKSLSPHSDAIRESAILLQKGDCADQFKFF